MARIINILHISQDIDDQILIEDALLELHRDDIDPKLANEPDWETASVRVAQGRVHVVLLDLSVLFDQDTDAMEALRSLSEHTAVVALVELGDEDLTDEAVLSGADDVLIKGSYDAGLLARAVQGAIAHHQIFSGGKPSVSSEVRTEQVEQLQQLLHSLRETKLTAEQQTLAEKMHHVMVTMPGADAGTPVVSEEIESVDETLAPASALPFDMWVLIKSVVDSYRDVADERGIELMAKITVGTPRHFIGDPARIRDVLHDLMALAFRTTHAGCVQVIVASHGEEQGKTKLYLAVKDTGPGYSTHLLERMLAGEEEGSTSHAEIRKVLLNCRDLSGSMRGRVLVKSVEGEGSTMCLHIALSQQAQSKHSTCLPQADVYGVRLLFVSGDSSRHMLHVDLRSQGVQSTLVADSAAAHVAARGAADAGEPFQLVVIDRELSDGNGMVLAQALEGLAPQHGCVLLTNNGQRGDGVAATAAGFMAYLSGEVDIRLCTRILETVWGCLLTEETMDLITRYTLDEAEPVETERVTGETGES